MFDLYLLPINLKQNREMTDIPGLYVSNPTRRAQRSRNKDVFLVLFTVFGGAKLSGSAQQEMFERISTVYYDAKGSVTNGMRLAADEMNRLILNYNAGLRGNRESDQVFGLLNLAVLRDDLVYLLHAGPTHSFLIRPEKVEEFHDLVPQNRGLGYGRSVSLSYYQTRISEGDVLVFCAEPAGQWNEKSLAVGQRISMNLLRRRMLSLAETDLQAAIVQFKPGTEGVVHKLKPRSPMERPAAGHPQSPETARDKRQAAAELPPEREIKPVPESSAAVQEDVPADEEDHLEDEASEQQENDKNWSSFSGLQSSQPDKPQIKLQEEPVPRSEPHQEKPRPQMDARQKALQAAKRQSQRKQLAEGWLKFSSGLQVLFTKIREFFARLLPGATDESPDMPASSLLFIAVVIPIMVVAVASTIYMRNGRSNQHQKHLEEAQYFALEAQSEEEVSLKRLNLQQANYWLDIAEEYGTTEVSTALRTQVSQELDILDGITRLNFSSAMATNFVNTISISQIAANDTEAYLLDSSQGRVMRLFLTGSGYELDVDFSCNPATLNDYNFGKLVDLIVLPPGNPNGAAVLGLDADGDFLYCIPKSDTKPLSSRLVAPEEGFGEIAAVSYYQGFMYLLDREGGNVYRYAGVDVGDIGDPSPFFDRETDEVPDLTDVVDLAVSAEDLYLLNSDGTVTICHSGMYETYQTRCEDPAPFGDLREGFEDQVLSFSNTRFEQSLTTSYPDPSFFLFDTLTPGIYRFSLQLNLDRIFQPSEFNDPVLPEEPATAFTISSSRVIFLAYGNKVYYAKMP